MTQLLVDRVNRTLTVDIHQAINLCIDSLLCLFKLRTVDWNLCPKCLISKIVLNSIRQYEVTISKTLHQSRSTKTVSTMVREVTLTNSKQTWNGCHQLIVNPDTTHCVVDSREDHHWIVVLHAVNLICQLTWVDVCNLLIHIEEVTITLKDSINTEAVDRLREVQEHSQTSVVYTEALIATLLSST